MSSQSVRINEASYRSLRRMARERGKSMQAVLEEVLQEYRRKRFWEETNAAFGAMRRQKRAWKQEQKERALWANALLDGVKDE